MCGIVGYVGSKQAYPILIKGLQRLEYRGYDSAGIAIMDGGLKLYKTKGKVSDLESFVEGKNLNGTIGIAHTRWATHGEPNNENAHPHFSESKQLALIHNGIIENYASLKEELVNRNYTFHSETDTEVLVYLIEDIKKNEGVSLEEAVRIALNQVIGAYAIVVISKDEPGLLVAARKGSPMVIGIGDDDFYIASDATPIAEYTKEVIYLDDEEIVCVRKGEEIV
ncbi:MAG: glutamine--fructose-6-phosphate aminotransferase, partial [Bacteroidetes bacterium]